MAANFAFEVDVRFAADVDGDGTDDSAGVPPGAVAGVVVDHWAAAVAADTQTLASVVAMAVAVRRQLRALGTEDLQG